MVELFEGGVVGFDRFVGRFEERKEYKKIKKLCAFCVSVVDLSQ